MNNQFEQYGFAPELIKSLDGQNVTVPTDIQKKVIPLALGEGDIVAKAPTGTGKTLAFVLPILSKIDREDNAVQALIVCPTRELVIQICEVIQAALKYCENIRTAGLYGGQNIQRQLFCLRKKPQIVVGTPGRLLDHIDRRTIKLASVKFFVLDEGDEMLDMGFRGDIEKISKSVGKCQKMCFSATLPQNILNLVEEFFDKPTFVKTADGEDIPKIEQYYAIVKDAQRVGALLKIIDDGKYERAIVFCNTKARADKLFSALIAKKRSVAVIHGDLRQTERTQIIKRFKSQGLQILVATDVAARGLDVEGVDVIINFDPPTDSDFYVHRIGRTARAKKEGVAYTLIDSSQVGYIPSFQKASDNALKFFELGNIADTFTLPKDSSNKIKDFRDNQSRFFLNVGKKDLLDKDSLTKLLLKSTPLKIFEISDIKIRDTYSFVSVIKGCEGKLFKLKGVTLGKRAVTIQEAKEEERPTENSNPKTSKDYGKKGKPAAKSFGNKPVKKAGGKKADGSKAAVKGMKKKGNKPVSRKSKFYSAFDE
ncbi:MAG: DEAD/DEAH box helicase [Clostridia bacterium]|nr:DEAD/DEAH box helicase [Clostridia bacterium]MDE7328239.1 DEAD/DEAH box helicase [Clostridia bacterium]